MDLPDLRIASEFTRFYRLNLPAVYGYLFRLCGSDRVTAEDLTQDTWMALAKEVRRGNSECADVRWLLTVARSRFLDHARREQRSERELALVSTSVSSEFAETPEKDDVLIGLDSLQPMRRSGIDRVLVKG